MIIVKGYGSGIGSAYTLHIFLLISSSIVRSQGWGVLNQLTMVGAEKTHTVACTLILYQEFLFSTVLLELLKILFSILSLLRYVYRFGQMCDYYLYAQCY